LKQKSCGIPNDTCRYPDCLSCCKHGDVAATSLAGGHFSISLTFYGVYVNDVTCSGKAAEAQRWATSSKYLYTRMGNLQEVSSVLQSGLLMRSRNRSLQQPSLPSSLVCVGSNVQKPLIFKVPSPDDETAIIERNWFSLKCTLW